MNTKKASNKVDQDEATGWMDTGWTKADALWFENTMGRRGQILQTDMSLPEHREKTMELWGTDLALLAGAGVERREAGGAAVPADWSSLASSRRWWQGRLNNKVDGHKSGAVEADKDGLESPETPAYGTDGVPIGEDPMDSMFREALYQQAEMIGGDRDAMGHSRPRGLAVDEWNDLVRLSNNRSDIEDEQELQALARTCGRRILFQHDSWPTGWATFGWSDGLRLHWVVYRLIQKARQQSEQKNKRLKDAFPLHQQVVNSWQQRFRDRKALLEYRRGQNSQAWQDRIALKMCQALDDDAWLGVKSGGLSVAEIDTEAKRKVLALNGWGHLMLGGGHDSWMGWVDARHVGLWPDLDP